VISQAGKRLQTAVVETNGRALVEAFRMIPGQKHLCLEEGTQSAWLYEILSPHVEEVAVAGVTKRRGQSDVSTRGRRASAEAETGSHDSRRTRKNCLAILPCGKRHYDRSPGEVRHGHIGRRGFRARGEVVCLASASASKLRVGGEQPKAASREASNPSRRARFPSLNPYSSPRHRVGRTRRRIQPHRDRHAQVRRRVHTRLLLRLGGPRRVFCRTLCDRQEKRLAPILERLCLDPSDVLAIETREQLLSRRRSVGS